MKQWSRKRNYIQWKESNEAGAEDLKLKKMYQKSKIEILIYSPDSATLPYTILIPKLGLLKTFFKPQKFVCDCKLRNNFTSQKIYKDNH